MAAGPTQTPRVGALGVLSATGSMLYRDANGDVTDVVPGNNGHVLTLVGGVPDWASPSLSVDAFQFFTGNDAVYGEINGFTGIAGTQVRNKRVALTFADAAAAPSDNEQIIFMGVLPSSYDSTKSLAVNVEWAAPAAIVVGSVKWNVAWERMNILGLDIDTENFSPVQTVTTVTAGATGQLSGSTIAFTSAQAGGLVSGEGYRLQVIRDANNVADTLVGDASVVSVSITEF